MFKFIEEKESFAKSNLNFSEELEEEFGRDLIKCDELISIAHYALDLWVQKEPWSCHKKTPNQIVAIVLRVIQRFNEGVGRFSTFLSTSELSEFAGWKNPGNVITAAYAAYNAVVGEVYDQGLLTMTTVDRLEESEEKDYVFPKPPLNPDEILIRRSEIEEDIIDMLKEINSQSSLDYIKDIIYNENDTSDLIKVVSVFDNGGDFSEMSNILELANDAWNFFPHKTLGGKAPVEMSSP